MCLHINGLAVIYHFYHILTQLDMVFLPAFFIIHIIALELWIFQLLSKKELGENWAFLG